MLRPSDTLPCLQDRKTMTFKWGVRIVDNDIGRHKTQSAHAGPDGQGRGLDFIPSTARGVLAQKGQNVIRAFQR